MVVTNFQARPEKSSARRVNRQHLAAGSTHLGHGQRSGANEEEQRLLSILAYVIVNQTDPNDPGTQGFVHDEVTDFTNQFLDFASQGEVSGGLADT